jgi:UV DNA damage endonuclease
MRFGFAVKVLGGAEGGLPSNDARRWQTGPHVRQSIEYARAIFEYLDRVDIRMYRMSSDFVPYYTHPDMPQFHGQLDEAREELAQLGALAQKYRIRLSLHPSQYIILNAQDEDVARKSIADLNAQARLLDLLGCGPESVVVTHVGGVYGDRLQSRQRFIDRFHTLPEATQKRLVVENDDVSFSLSDALEVHRQTGIRVIFDNLHHFCLNPEGLPMHEALRLALDTWPADVTPKIHYSSPSTTFESTEVKEKSPNGRTRTVVRLRSPRTKAHADFINPLEFTQFWQAVRADELRPFDIMLESKGKDLALLRLRQELARQNEVPRLRELVTSG